ncbi:39S ribosomal protein L43, mitochondrial [Neodiprion fabricii]|uniref:39S ribosomal protein L43, mitochondrial n=1 Tax=Neodiprion fabricii TaxID=2872261 RepID=UPI001ED9597D|nr:39S ribosomal protein L43, mitochondrial [Neodiprion fabricii]
MSNSHLFMKTGFPRAALNNGIGRYVCQLQRVTIKFCKSNGSSRGVRDFLEHDLVNFAKENPGIVVYVKPRRHRTPALSAEYLNGEKQLLFCRNYTREEVNKWLGLLRSQVRDTSAIRLRKMWHTDNPSIQGPWTPWTFRDPAQNLVEFPDPKLFKMETEQQTATEKLLEIFKAQQEAERKRANETG